MDRTTSRALANDNVYFVHFFNYVIVRGGWLVVVLLGAGCFYLRRVWIVLGNCF